MLKTAYYAYDKTDEATGEKTNDAPDELRRAYASALVAQGGETQWQEAVRLFGQSSSSTSVANLDKRTRAVLFARRGGEEHRRTARQLLEELVAESEEPAPLDRLLLARLYEMEGNLPAAQQQYELLTSGEILNPAYARNCIIFLLKHNLLDDADRWIGQLEVRFPDNPLVTEQRVRWLNKNGRSDEIGPIVEGLAARLLDEHAEDEKTESQLCVVIGNLYAIANLGRVQRRLGRGESHAPENAEQPQHDRSE